MLEMDESRLALFHISGTLTGTFDHRRASCAFLGMTCITSVRTNHTCFQVQ